MLTSISSWQIPVRCTDRHTCIHIYTTYLEKIKDETYIHKHTHTHAYLDISMANPHSMHIAQALESLTYIALYLCFTGLYSCMYVCMYVYVCIYAHSTGPLESEVYNALFVCMYVYMYMYVCMYYRD